MFTVPDLPYDYNALEPYIDEETMHLHHDKHHAAYVNNLNDALAGQEELLKMPIEELLQNLDKVPEGVRTKVRNNGGGHYNHSMYWASMKVGGGKSATALTDSITSSFGNIEGLQEKMNQAGLGRFGSGWVWLSIDKGKLVVTDSPNQDCPLMEGVTPILGIDVWEHAYYLKYKNVRGDYLKAWWNVVDWDRVSQRFQEAMK